MAFLSLPELLISILVLLVVWNLLLPVEWPVVDILPSVAINLHRLHHYIAFDLLAPSGHRLKFTIASIQMFLTRDPVNIQQIFTLNHKNYPKVEEFADIFEVARGSLFTVDGVLSSPRLVGLMNMCCRDKVEKGLLPFMAHMTITNALVDMNGLMMRLLFDLYAITIFSVDSARLSLDMPAVHVADAMDIVMEVAFLQHIVPAFFWKVMRLLDIGPERKLASAQAVLRSFTMDMVMKRRGNNHVIVQEVPLDILSNYVNDPRYNDDLLQATLITYMIAERDTIGTTLLWVIYNLAKNPHVVSSIRDELASIISRRQSIAGATMKMLDLEEVKALVYLQATILETLRLYPPIPIERKSVVANDVMPSGHEVCARDIIVVSIYSIGRMESVWGADFREYRPKRWLSEDGRQLRHVPSHKYCNHVDEDHRNFDVKMLDGQTIDAKLSCLLQMKNGFKVKLNKREM
ncbi:hypothetical protein VPH35_017736 [Triticum aestivum]